jgi:hypothetical protein
VLLSFPPSPRLFVFAFFIIRFGIRQRPWSSKKNWPMVGMIPLSVVMGGSLLVTVRGSIEARMERLYAGRGLFCSGRVVRNGSTVGSRRDGKKEAGRPGHGHTKRSRVQSSLQTAQSHKLFRQDMSNRGNLPGEMSDRAVDRAGPTTTTTPLCHLVLFF